MHSYKKVLIHLHQLPTYLGAKKRAADVAADMTLTCRRRSADIAAVVAADVGFSERPESDFSDPIHMIAYLRNIAPQKRSWRFL